MIQQSLSRRCTQGNDIIMLKRNSQFHIHFTALFARAKTWEQCKRSSTDEQVSWQIYTVVLVSQAQQTL